MRASLILVSLFIGQTSFAQLDLSKLKNVKINIKNGKTTVNDGSQPAQPAAAPAAAAPAPAPAPAAKLGPSPICNAQRSIGICYAFTGAEGSDAKKSKGNQMACKMMRGTWLGSATCLETAAYGRCTVLAGQPGEYSLYYYAGGKMTKEKAMADCADPKSSIHRQGAGAWTAL